MPKEVLGALGGGALSGLGGKMGGVLGGALGGLGGALPGMMGGGIPNPPMGAGGPNAGGGQVCPTCGGTGRIGAGKPNMGQMLPQALGVGGKNGII